MATLALIACAYLIGSVSFAVVTSKAFGLPDPHTYGSGNPGATNVLRTGNRLAAILTLVGDGAKGWLAVYLGNRAGIAIGDASLATAGSALAVFLGHLFPVFHRFRGGKGVATAGGILLALDWRLGAGVLAVWLVVAVVTRISSLASISAALAAPAIGLWLLGNWPEAWVLVPIAALLVWRHRANIRKLMAGTEARIGASPGK
jgi:glycerol-3-phosphate acyltransferase PlsY